MMNKASKHNIEDEIDLGVLLLRITRSVSKNIILISVLCTLGIGLGVFNFFFKKPVYESNMVIQSSILTGAYTRTASRNLSQLIEENSLQLLAEKLHISKSEAAHISMLSIKTTSEEIIRESDGAEIFDNFFEISVEVNDNTILPKLQAGILSYLENSPYVSKQITAKKKALKSIIKKIDDELLAIDSMKSNLGNNISYNKSDESNIVIFDPSDIHSKSLSFFKEKTRRMEELTIINGIQLIDGFVSFKKPASPKLSISALIGLASGLLLSLAIILVKELRAYLNKLEKELESTTP